MSQSFGATLARINRGEFVAACGEELAKLVKAVAATGKSGELTITIKLSMHKGAMAIDPDVRLKLPRVKPDGAILWPTEDGDLVANNPAQQQLPLRSVSDDSPVEIRAVR